MPTLPTFLVVGAMRSGTTSLVRHLGAHPDVFVAAQKEVHFFDSHYELGVEWYQEQFARAGTAQAVGEGTPRYMYEDRCVTRMAEIVPHARLLVILRDPVDRAYSHYWHNRSRGREDLSFADALASEPSRSTTSYAYKDRGRYLRQLEGLTRHFPAEQIHVLLLDDLQARPVETLASAFAFVGVDPDVAPPPRDEPANRFYEYRYGRLQQLARTAPKPIGSLIGRLNRIDRRYPPLDEALRAQLAAEFHDDNAALARWLGRDLSHWG